ncbi:MAG TPA: carbohydrate ABC transporter permease, partial [Acidimicrobiales bacterium]|nr:carbohydrate ABC transporter permease [Acidimicrobiales bacterium]
MTIAVVLLALPIAWGIITALKPDAAAFDNSLSSLAHATEFSNFVSAWDYGPFGQFLINGLIVGAGGALITVGTSLLSGYGFARLRFRGREKLFFLYVATLVIPQEVLVVPMYILMRDFGWVNSYQALIVPWAFSGFGVFLMRQFFRTVPLELEDAAKVDGASHLYIFTRVMVPMVRPAIGVLGLFTFIAYWNSFLWPLIIINSRSRATVPLGLQYFLTEQGGFWNLLMAGGTISLVPGLILAFLLQRWLSEGISLSGL